MNIKTKRLCTIGMLLSLIAFINLGHSSTNDVPKKESVNNAAFKKLVKGLIADDYTQVLQALNEGAPYKTQRYKKRKIVELAVSHQRIETLKALIDYAGVDNLIFQRSNLKNKKNNNNIYSVKSIMAEAFLGLYFDKKYGYHIGANSRPKLKKRLDIFHKTLVDYILSQSPNINVTFAFTGNNVRTPLSIAAEYNDLDMVKRLLKMGANPNLPAYNPNMKRTVMPLGGAGKNNNIEMLKVLLDNKADVDHPYFDIGPIRDEDAFLLIYNAGYDVSRTNYFLFRGIWLKWNKLVDLAISSGANVHNFFEKGKKQTFTPLAEAILYNNIYAYQALLKAGADPCLGDKGAYVMDRLRVIEKPIQDVLPYLKAPMQAAGCEGLLEIYYGHN